MKIKNKMTEETSILTGLLSAWGKPAPFNLPEPKDDCRHCGGTGQVAMLRFSVPCECLEPYFGWAWPDSGTVLYYNLKGEEVEVSSVSRESKPPNPRAIYVGRLCYYSRPGRDDDHLRKEMKSIEKRIKKII